ncbi:MAG: hypothetical protein JO199_07185 [Candidatus Eremiobacteraeota bacterium]|nr:hypothetical protein [Candidatus Eremiobacteraeota bacterium]
MIALASFVVWMQLAAPVATPSTGTLPCVTYVRAVKAPAKLHYTVNGVVLGTLADETVVDVDADVNGWLHVLAPQAGWLDANDTSVRCGPEGADLASTVAAIDALGRAAAREPVAMDTLVRYALVAQGEASHRTAVAIASLMTHDALQLTSAFDQLTADQRRWILLDVIEHGATGAQLKAFAKALPSAPTLSTLATWESIVSHCDESLRQRFPWLCQ